ncbi:MAG: sigma-54 dependent transcriptional regulator, partial [Alphaproteobacteria bacterium]
YDVRATGSAAVLWQWVAAGEGDLVITDVVMPDGDGLDLIPRLRRRRPELPVIAMSARSTLSTAVRAAQRGAFDYLAKPFDLDTLVRLAARALSRDAGAAGVAPPVALDGPGLVGRSPAMQEVYRVMARLSGGEHTVLLSGESGVGKSLVAWTLHDQSRRRLGPFVALPLAGMTDGQVDEALSPSPVSGARLSTRRRVGRVAEARGGTLYLPDVAEAAPSIQARLARFLGEIAGASAGHPASPDVRVIAATTGDLRHAVANGRFREDLFYRLNVVPLQIPPLRQRRQDIPDLVHLFLSQAAADKRNPKTMGAAALACLSRHDWPGNVRELRNTVLRLAALEPASDISAAAVAQALDPGPDGTAAGMRSEATVEQGPASGLAASVSRHLAAYFETHNGELPNAGLYDRIVREVERPLIARCLEATRGNQLKAAELLGLNRNTLRKKIRMLDIPVVRRLK